MSRSIACASSCWIRRPPASIRPLTASSRLARSLSLVATSSSRTHSRRCSRSIATPKRSPCTASRGTKRGRASRSQRRSRGFLDYLRDGVIVGHHIGHDIATIDAACERHWGVRLMNRSLDTMDLTLHLERDGAFAGRPPIRRFTLDALCTAVRRDPARSSHGNRRRVHHRAGISQAGAAGVAMRSWHACANHRAVRRRTGVRSGCPFRLSPSRAPRRRSTAVSASGRQARPRRAAHRRQARRAGPSTARMRRARP